MSDLPDPSLIWRDDGHPYSARFGDVYFSGDGVAESQHVFIDGIGGADLWSDKPTFSVAETGFGTGLNFLMLWDAWRRSAPQGARLNYISVEGFPLGLTEMARAGASLGDVAPLSEALCAALPPCVGGYHAVELDGGRVRLLLLYGPVAEMLGGLQAAVDAWFLDGFAPARNPAMWTPDVFAEIARLSRPGARLASFTVVGAVRRGLAEVGFAIEKRPGYGAKRKCLAGRFEGVGARDPIPWFALPKPRVTSSSDKVAVIGSGIAGCCIARALAGRGLDVTVFDAGDGPASGASGTPAAIVQPRPFSGEDANGWFHRAAYRRAVALYDELAEAGAEIWARRGLLVTGRDEEDAERYRCLVETDVLGPGAAAWLTADEASSRSGMAVEQGGMWLSEAGSLNTAALCRALIGDLEVQYRTSVERLQHDAGEWRLLGAGGAMLGRADAVVLAAGYAAQQLGGFDALGLFANRGQVTLLEPAAAIAGQRAPLTYGGYLAPNGDHHVLGSSYTRLNDPSNRDWGKANSEDNAANLGLLAARFPDLAKGLTNAAKAGAWVGLRATTPDRFPVVGGVPDGGAYRSGYAKLRHGGSPAQFPMARYRDGLYLMAGLGSRGFLTAPLAADMLAAMMVGDPMPQPRAVLDAMHPARFLIRDLKRGRGGAKMDETAKD